jgi:uncharacterized membrane protein YtjA (UPF0391 family)
MVIFGSYFNGPGSKHLLKRALKCDSKKSLPSDTPAFRVFGRFADIALTLSIAGNAEGRLFARVSQDRRTGGAMLYYALVFLVIALIAGFLGFGGVAFAAAGVAKILFFIFLVIFVITLVAHLLRGRTAP